jgi:hypothetical protein
MSGDSLPRLDTGQPPRSVCARCGTALACDPGGDCWCKHKEVRLPMPAEGESCLCADCLRAAATNP